MKRLLSIIGAISLVGTSTTSLVACNTQEYSSEKLKELKEKNKINTTDENVKNNLEWIAPQEKPFNKVDNKYYYVVWHGDENKWILTQFNNNINNINKKLGEFKKYKLILSTINTIKYRDFKTLVVSNNNSKTEKNIEKGYIWEKDSYYFKAVYRWNLETKEPDLFLDENNNVKISGE